MTPWDSVLLGFDGWGWEGWAALLSDALFLAFIRLAWGERPRWR